MNEWELLVFCGFYEVFYNKWVISVCSERRVVFEFGVVFGGLLYEGRFYSVFLMVYFVIFLKFVLFVRKIRVVNFVIKGSVVRIVRNFFFRKVEIDMFWFVLWGDGINICYVLVIG